jgi:hypothetical protein
MTPSPTTASSSTPAATPRLPPDERFWQRYSPHHEFPLSGVLSAGLHLVVVALLLLAAWVAFSFVSQANKPLPVEAISVEHEGGSGGDPRGAGNVPGTDSTRPPAAENTGPTEGTGPAHPDVKLNDLDAGKVDPLEVNLKDERGENPFPVSPDVRERLEKVSKALRQELNKGLAAPKGERGPKGGDKNGPGDADARGNLTQRQKRVLRWSMVFNTESGEDYLRQLANIKPGSGAILAVPQGPDGKSFRVLRDLKRHPAAGEVEDLAKIHRIYWVDDKPESVRGLARALGIPAPPYIVAFFPEELEQHLAKLERDYKGRSEDQIAETKFSVLRSPDGAYRAQVVAQVPKP